MPRSIETSEKGEIVPINDLHRLFPGQWVALRVTDYKNDAPIAGVIVKHSDDGEAVLATIAKLRGKGGQQYGVYRAVESFPPKTPVEDQQTKNQVIEDYVEWAEHELREVAGGESIVQFAERLVADGLDDARAVLAQGTTAYRESRPELSPPETQNETHRMLSAMLVTTMGNSSGFIHLGAMLLTDELNRKMTIIDFLGNLTEGRIGASVPEVPHKERVLKWCNAIQRLDGESPTANHLTGRANH